MDRVQGFYAGKTALIVGATGFLGKPLVEKLLRAAPDIRRVYVLIREKTDARGRTMTAQERFEQEMLPIGVFDRLREEWGADFDARVREKVKAVNGDIGLPKLGMSDEVYDALAAEVQIVVNSAAVVVFDSPLDEALEMNAEAPRRIVQFAQECGGAVLAHISTAYVNAGNPNAAPEAALPTEKDKPDGWTGPVLPHDVDKEIETLKRACEEGEYADEKERRTALVKAGMDRARERGWSDTYAYTKALGERVTELSRGDLPVLIVRPSIIESSLREPDPGWIDGFRMADPIIAAFGKGRLPDFPLNPEVTADLIPVDYVVNATLTAVVETAEKGGMRHYHVASGAENPLSYRNLYQYTRDYFLQWPMTDKSGSPVAVPEFTFPPIEAYQAQLRRKLKLLGIVDKLLSAVPSKRMRRRRQRLSLLRNAGERLLYYTEIYGPYIQNRYLFDTSKTRAMMERQTDEERQRWGFDVSKIDWRAYLMEAHIPGLKRNVLKISDDAEHVDRPMSEGSESWT